MLDWTSDCISEILQVLPVAYKSFDRNIAFGSGPVFVLIP